MARFYMQEFRRVPNMSDYGSTGLDNAWICLNMAEYCWMSLNMPEYAWINCPDYAKVLIMPRYS